VPLYDFRNGVVSVRFFGRRNLPFALARGSFGVRFFRLFILLGIGGRGFYAAQSFQKVKQSKIFRKYKPPDNNFLRL